MERFEAYLCRLPNGLDSYPKYVQKSSILRAFLRAIERLEFDRAQLPEPLRDLIEVPPPSTAWVRETHAMGLFLAVADLCFPTDDAYVEFWAELNAGLLSSPLYRVLMRVASPLQVVKGAARRWNQLHRGISMHVAMDMQQATLRLAFPEHLVVELLAKTYATAFLAALHMAGGDAVSCGLTRCEPTLAVYEAEW